MILSEMRDSQTGTSMSKIGNGDLASVLPDREDLLFFAAGVSNPGEIPESEYRREIALLSKQPRNKRLVYFSSLTVFYSDSRFARHKRAMEDMVKKYSKYWCIVRIGSITWGTNPYSLVNYLIANPAAEIPDEYRFIVDKEEFLFWINMIPPRNVEMNIPGKRMTVQEVKDGYA